MQQISETEFEAAFYGHMSEVFETFLTRRFHVEVLYVEDENDNRSYIVALSDCEDCEYYNASSYYHHQGEQYAFIPTKTGSIHILPRARPP